MGDLSAHFSRHEFACKCGCGFDTVDVVLNRVLELVRRHFKAPVIVSGRNRCPFQNAATPGAARGSLHTEGKAADIKVEGVTPEAVYDFLDKKFPKTFGIGLYNNRVHIDVRAIKARWGKPNA